MIVGALACSHAIGLMDPGVWEEVLGPNRKAYEARYGRAAQRAWDWSTESRLDAEAAYGRYKSAFNAAAAAIQSLDPSVVVVIGGDQDEDLTDVLPQFAIYTGAEFTAEDYLEKRGNRSRYAVPSGLARSIRDHAVAEGFDVATLLRLPGGLVQAHAVGPLLKALSLGPGVRVIPLYVETLHLPAPSPKRCHELGRTLRQAIEQWEGSAERVLICASGGLSHFTASYPFDALQSGFGYGAISTDFDAMLMREVRAGNGERLCESIGNRDLIDNGDVEFRPWGVALGAIGSQRPGLAHYEAIFHAGLGMAVCQWTF